MEKIFFESPEEGFKILMEYYFYSEVTGGEMVDNMFTNEEFSTRINRSTLKQAIKLFKNWDEE